MWSYACHHSRITSWTGAQLTQFRHHCNGGELDGADLAQMRAFCHASSHRIIKEIRLPFAHAHVLESLQQLAQQGRVRILVLFRHPLAILRSQFAIGWHASVATTDELLQVGERLCSYLQHMHATLQRYALAEGAIHAISYRYEDITANLSVGLTSLLHDLQLPYSYVDCGCGLDCDECLC